MSERLIVLGTGNANATKCYNTCFAIDDGKELLLCDAGGGNGILRQLETAGIGLDRIRHIIVTHAHTDHVMGVIWLIRMAAARMNAGKDRGEVHLYASPEVCAGLMQMASFMLQPKMIARIGKQILFHEIADGQTETIAGRETVFFDIGSTKMQQYGFTLRFKNGRRLCCLGDEPYNPICEKYAMGADWLLSEAFCRYCDRDVFKPYEKHHSTVREACELAAQLGVPNLVLWHTEDRHICERKQLYKQEGSAYYQGCLYVPDDLDVIEL